MWEKVPRDFWNFPFFRPGKALPSKQSKSVLVIFKLKLKKWYIQWRPNKKRSPPESQAWFHNPIVFLSWLSFGGMRAHVREREETGLSNPLWDKSSNPLWDKLFNDGFFLSNFFKRLQKYSMISEDYSKLDQCVDYVS